MPRNKAAYELRGDPGDNPEREARMAAGPPAINLTGARLNLAMGRNVAENRLETIPEVDEPPVHLNRGNQLRVPKSVNADRRTTFPPHADNTDLVTRSIAEQEEEEEILKNIPEGRISQNVIDDADVFKRFEVAGGAGEVVAEPALFASAATASALPRQRDTARIEFEAQRRNKTFDDPPKSRSTKINQENVLRAAANQRNRGEEDMDIVEEDEEYLTRDNVNDKEEDVDMDIVNEEDDDMQFDNDSDAEDDLKRRSPGGDYDRTEDIFEGEF